MAICVPECTRHGFPWGPDTTSSAYLVRCVHVAARFVVEIHSNLSDFCATDYVEELSSGGVIVEAAHHGDWDNLVARMMAALPPDPEAEH